MRSSFENHDVARLAFRRRVKRPLNLRWCLPIFASPEKQNRAVPDTTDGLFCAQVLFLETSPPLDEKKEHVTEWESR